MILLYCNAVSAQRTMMDIAANKPLTEVLVEIGYQKCVSFLYEPVVLFEARVANTYSLKGNVSEMLDCLLPPLNLKYKKVGRKNYVILSGETSPFMPNSASDKATQTYASLEVQTSNISVDERTKSLNFKTRFMTRQKFGKTLLFIAPDQF